MKIKQWNSTLKADPAKALKRKKPMRQMSQKTRQRIKDYREKAFEHYGHRCFLCGRTDESGKTLDIHHITGRTNGDDITNIVPLCNRFSGCKAHSHTGKDKTFYELKEKIEKKLKNYLTTTNKYD